jgi:glycosyltransferase involved in cell wall biosynthesis
LFLNEDLPSYLDCVNLLLAPYSHAWAASGGAASLLLAAKKPIIASNCPAFLAVQHQSQCLALFEAEVVEDLVHTIKQLTASPKEQAFLVTALNRYAQDHCEQSIAQVLLQTYAMAKTTLLTQAIQQET